MHLLFLNNLKQIACNFQSIFFVFVFSCRKVIVILSPEFLESEECNFMLSLSLSVDPSEYFFK